jgi:glucose/arabinose dehydrogenase
VSRAHELSGLGSTRVVRFSASGWRRIDEPDDVATGPENAEVSGRFEPLGTAGAIDPRFSENRTIYFSYVHGTDKSSTVRVAKAKFDDTGNRLRNHRVIFESTPGTGAELVGGRVAVTADGHVFLTLGGTAAGRKLSLITPARSRPLPHRWNGAEGQSVCRASRRTASPGAGSCRPARPRAEA